MKVSFITATALLAGSAQAHTVLQWFWPDNTMAGSTQSCVRMPPSNSPIENVSSSDMSCNVNGNVPAASVCNVSAGSTVKVEWHHTNRQQGPQDGDDPIASSHKGPIIFYLAKVDNAATVTNTATLNWFKFQEEGLNGGVWAVDKLVAAKTGTWDVKLPTSIPSGDYLLRGEIIALHSASNYPGAQFYMGCVQIKVSGGAGGNPSPLVKFPGAYSGSDPGVRINIWQGVSSYTIPGGPVASFGGSAPPPVITTTTRGPTPIPTPTPTPPTGCSSPVAKWQQCGGQGWSGSTCCESGSTCSAINDYYHQCI